MKTNEDNLKYLKKLLENLFVDEERVIVLSNRQIERLAKILAKKKRSENSELALITGYIKIHAQIENVVYGDGLAEEKSHTRGILKKFKHSINLNPIRRDIQYVYGKKNTIFLNWHNPYSQGIDQVAVELEDYGIFLQSDNQLDQFAEIYELWVKSRPDYVSDYCDDKELKKIVKEKSLLEL